jgi:hypothetical protein
MKTIIKPKIQKVRNRLHQDEIYYTWSNWEPKEIEGQLFLAVVKYNPSENKLQRTHYIRKDNMEYIK